MSFPQGINFREGAGFVTDGANDYAELNGTATYPDVSTQGNNVGYETVDDSPDLWDNDNSVDPRLAGSHDTLNADGQNEY